MVVNIIKGIIDYQLVEGFRDSVNKNKARSMKAKLKLLDTENYFVNDIYNELYKLPLHCFPSREDLLGYAVNFFQLHLKSKRRIKCPADEVWQLIYTSKERLIIEIMSMMNHSSENILGTLKSLKLDVKDLEQKHIDDYLHFFWDYKNLDVAEKNIFFSNVMDHPYYNYHRALWCGSASSKMILSLIGVNLWDDQQTDRISNLIDATLDKLPEALLSNDIKKLQAITNCLKSLAETHDKLGGKVGEEAEKMSDYIELIYDDHVETRTMQDLERENEEIDRKRAAGEIINN